MMRPILHNLLIDIRFMHKCGTCKTKGKVSVVKVIEHVRVMARCEPSAVCSGRKCDESGVIANNMVKSEVI